MKVRGVIQHLGLFFYISATLGKGNQILEIWAPEDPTPSPHMTPSPTTLPNLEKFRMLIEHTTGSCHEIFLKSKFLKKADDKLRKDFSEGIAF